MGVVVEMESGSGKSPRAIKGEEIVAEIEKMLAESQIGVIYRDRILTARTRRYELKPGSKNADVEILHTLLGIELKIGKKRLLCPDLATARYLSVFARIGAEAVAVPYDITQISRLADDLESSWYRMLTLGEHLTAGRTEQLRRRVIGQVILRQREMIRELGGGALIPQFVQETRQRKRS